jgi:DNA-binding XRE family transcriptional regulator
MRRKISNAPAPIRPPPPGGHIELPEREAKPRPELPKATSPSAILACHRFWRAASDCDKAIKMAHDPKIDEKHWASVRQQWLVWRHDAERRAELCKTEGLPEPQVTEVFHKLDSLGHQWKIACDYRNNDTKSQPAKAPSTRHRPQIEKALERLKNYRDEKKPLEGMTKKELAFTCGVSRNTAVKAFKEFQLGQSGQLTVKNDKFDK